MNASKNSKENSTVKPQSEELSNQIDRLNEALKGVMQDIEISSFSRNGSRLSLRTPDFNNDDFASPENSIILDLNYDQTIESLLSSLDRQQMIIEDFRSEELRKSPPSTFENLDRIRKEIWLEVKSQQKDHLQREKNLLEEKTRQAEQMKEKYSKSNNELLVLMQKLKQKEDLLTQKENELRSTRLNLDKMKTDIEMTSDPNNKQLKPSHPPPARPNHGRSHSFSFFTATNESPSGSLQDELKALTSQLKSLENELTFVDSSRKEDKVMKIEALKNKIARVRGEIAISESHKGCGLICNMMESLQKEVDREEKVKRNELFIAANKNLALAKHKPPLVPSKMNTPDGKIGKSSESFYSEGKGKALNLENIEKLENNENLKLSLDKKLRNFNDKERDLHQREILLNETIKRVSGARELMDNVTLTIDKLNLEKKILKNPAI